MTDRRIRLPRERDPVDAELDADGYPLDECLEEIKRWPIEDRDGWLAYVRALWNVDYGDERQEYANDGESRLVLTTGGWSGNEEIIGAMSDNTVLYMMTWISSRRGGRFEFQLREGDDDSMD